MGREQMYHPEYSATEKAYISIFGMPVVGLRIRGRNIFSLIPEGKNFKNILDAGSGSGVFSFELGRGFPNAKVLGIDTLPEAVSASTSIARKIEASNVRFLRTSIEDLREKNFFDLAICVDILEHIEDDMAALRSLYDATAPGGTLVLHVPSLYRRYPVFKRCPNFDVPTHVRAGYEQDEIREKVANSGFSIRNIGLTYGFWETLANNISYMITKARKKNKAIYAVVFPILNLISLVGAQARPEQIGAGVFIVAQKDRK